MSGWRVWLAFEVRPGIHAALQDRSAHWRGLADACRGPDGKIDPVECVGWIDFLVDHAHLWGYA